MFPGAINSITIHPCKVVKSALINHAAVFLLARPTGRAAPSKAERLIAERLKQALELVDTCLLDALVIGGMDNASISEHGWL
ncbi:JAB domain-containing protein [Enterobacter sp. UNJFSC 003]|uniref:JAB domain-containing protein n=1 Tax=Enterobacter sp. UNJFSC 003 TaxID=3122077 RepID=UPI002ECCB935|nr:JAB domain-containing protein [Serratia liquefaciens]